MTRTDQAGYSITADAATTVERYALHSENPKGALIQIRPLTRCLPGRGRIEGRA